MRLPAWILAPLAALFAFAVLFFAPSARADGFYVTFSNGVTIARTKGAAFDSTSAAPVAYASTATGAKSMVTALHVEIDDYNQAMALAAAIDGGKTFSVSIDMTTPNASGVETTYLTYLYSSAQLANLKFTYTASPQPVFSEVFDVLFGAIATSTPPAAPAKAPLTKIARPISVATVALMKSASIIGNTAAATLTNANVVIPPTPGWGSPGVAMTSFSVTVTQPRDVHTGVAAGQIQRGMVSFGKSPAPPSLAASVNNRFNNVAFNFVNHPASGSDTILLTMSVPQCVLASDTVQASGGTSSEQGSFSGATYTLTQGSSSTTY